MHLLSSVRCRLRFFAVRSRRCATTPRGTVAGVRMTIARLAGRSCVPAAVGVRPLSFLFSEFAKFFIRPSPFFRASFDSARRRPRRAPCILHAQPLAKLMQKPAADVERASRRVRCAVRCMYPWLNAAATFPFGTCSAGLWLSYGRIGQIDVPC